MIIWINGAFGAGKTTLAGELQRRLPEALVFDPEMVGYILTRCVPYPASGDYQDIPLWRTLVAQFAIGVATDYGSPLIVPMTLVNPAYRDEIFGLIGAAGERPFHVFLEVPGDELRRRIDAQVLVADDPETDAANRAFRHRNVDRCVAARAELPAGTLILRGERYTPEQLADLVIAELEDRAALAAHDAAS
jgi:AAA domain-containing protein